MKHGGLASRECYTTQYMILRKRSGNYENIAAPIASINTIASLVTVNPTIMKKQNHFYIILHNQGVIMYSDVLLMHSSLCKITL